MWEAVEEFSRQHQYTLSALSAFGTLAAVTVSIFVAWVALKERKPQLRAVMSINSIYHHTIDENGPRPTYIVVDVTNSGYVEVHVPFSFFQMMLPLQRKRFIINPLNAYGVDEWVPQIQFPFEVRPRRSHAFFLSELATFKKNMAKALEPKSTMYRLLFTGMHPLPVLADGTRFPIKVSKDVQEILSQAIAMTPRSARPR